MAKAQDLTGKQFGRLKVLKFHSKDNRGKYKWLCLCECGNTKITDTGQLNSGMTKSCGCIHREQLIERNKSHGLAHTPIYNVWSSMKRRCNCPTDKSYHNYGGRGIGYSEDWETFENFYKDMGETYKEGLTLERVDNEKGYSKENCVWANMRTQANNTRHNKILTVLGQTGTMAELCRLFGVKYSMVQNRIYKGWDVEKAFLTPKLR